MKRIKIKKHGVLVCFCIIFLVMSFFSFDYYRRVQSTIQEESSGYLQEISNRIGNNINKTINENYSVLKTMGVYLQNANANSFADVEPVVKEQQNYWNYQDIMLIDGNGKAYTAQGKEVTLTGDVYLQDAVLNKTQSLSMYQMIDGKECIVFAIPLENMRIGGIEMVALAASYEATTFNQLLSMTSFNEQAYSHIIRKNGTIVVRSDSKKTIDMGYNILSTIRNTEIDETSYDLMLKDIEKNQTGQITFTLDGVKSYMVYTPINPEDWYLLTFVPVNVVNEKSDLLLKTTLLLIAAVITIFAGMLVYLAYTFRQNKKRLEQIAYVDDITGGNTFKRFFELIEQYLTANKDDEYAIIYTNIVKFKIMNDQFGREVCDLILKKLYTFIESSLNQGECIGRISGDNFAILVKYEGQQAIVERFKEWFKVAEAYVENNVTEWSLPVVELGIYVIDADKINYSQMLDRAKLSLKDYSQLINNKMHYAIYNEAARDKILREKNLEDKMEVALLNNHFQVYLQPKYRLPGEKIGGAEALIRWIDPEEGMIFPDEFIPLFEKNGFVVQLDLWVFEQVCKYLKSCIEQGKEIVKISVNCSKVQLKNRDFLDEYKRIFAQYELPEKIIEIELTESVVMEDGQRIIEIVDEIHTAGFGCSMDDFGSGYSSLNLVQTLPVDTLKIDKIFFKEEGTNESKMEAVVGGIIAMAKALQMEIVAEGVEKPVQVDMLRKFDCDYIQGYVYAKPMPIGDFDDLLNNKK